MLRLTHLATAAAACSALLLAHCVRVPAPDYLAKGPQVDEIVKRVKCDLYEAVADKLNAPEGYEWLHSWTAQANLNLIVNDQSQLTPGATFTEPLRAATIPLKVTNFAQSANLGLGAGTNTTATRNETITFTVSMNELMDEFGKGQHNCDFPDKIDLQSELGLKEWVEAALSPVADGDLSVGYHKAPKQGTGGAKSGQSAAAPAIQAITKTNLLGAAAPGITHCELIKRPPPWSSPATDRIGIGREVNTVWCDLLKILSIPDLKNIDGDQVRVIATAIRDIQRAIQSLAITNQNPDLRKTLENTAIDLSIFVDPPIDTIAHQVQFVILWNASASPSWTLVHFKGPNPSSGSLFSATRTKTHTLNIVMGPPSSPDTSGALQALQIGTAVGNALGVTGGL